MTETPTDGVDQQRGIACRECESGTLLIADGVFAECDNCDAAFLRLEVGL